MGHGTGTSGLRLEDLAFLQRLAWSLGVDYTEHLGVAAYLDHLNRL